MSEDDRGDIGIADLLAAVRKHGGAHGSAAMTCERVGDFHVGVVSGWIELPLSH
jgi:hypothetical protein